jgi:hypothetical protein
MESDCEVLDVFASVKSDSPSDTGLKTIRRALVKMKSLIQNENRVRMIA